MAHNLNIDDILMAFTNTDIIYMLVSRMTKCYVVGNLIQVDAHGVPDPTVVGKEVKIAKVDMMLKHEGHVVLMEPYTPF